MIHIQAGSADHAPFDGLNQCGLVDERAAGGVDDADGWFAASQAFGVEERALTGRRHVQGDEVGLGAQVIELHELDIEV